MKTLKISLNSIDKVKAFVNEISKFDCDFDLVSGRSFQADQPEYPCRRRSSGCYPCSCSGICDRVISLTLCRRLSFVTHSIRHLFRRYIRETFQMSAGYFLPVSDF